MPIRSCNNSSVGPETCANVFSFDEAAYAVGATKQTLAWPSTRCSSFAYISTELACEEAAKCQVCLLARNWTKDDQSPSVYRRFASALECSVRNTRQSYEARIKSPGPEVLGGTFKIGTFARPARPPLQVSGVLTFRIHLAGSLNIAVEKPTSRD
jgi:hypothetical protein